MTEKQQTIQELQTLKEHLEQIHLLSAQIGEQTDLVDDLDQRRREEGFPKEPQLSTSMSTACREKQAALIQNWERLPSFLAWLFVVAVAAAWLLLRGPEDLLDPIVLCVLIVVMMRQHSHIWTAVTCVLTGAWAFGAQFFSDTQEIAAMIPMYMGYAAVAFKVIHQIVQAVRMILLQKEEKNQLAQEAADYENLCIRHEKNCQRVQEENDAKYNPQIEQLRTHLQELEERCNRHRVAADQATVLHDSDKKLDEVTYLISRFETKRADTLKEALLQYDAMEEKLIRKQKEEERQRQKEAMEQFNRQMEQFNRQMERERQAQQELENMERNWQLQQQQRRQADELERIRMALEN